MKLTSIALLILGAIGTIIGIMPLIFNYQISDGPYSGPANTWELILMLAYEGHGLYLIIGLVLLLTSLFSLLKHKIFKSRIR